MNTKKRKVTSKKKENKDHRIILRLTESEWKLLNQRVKKTTLTQSELVRNLIFDRLDKIPDAKNMAVLSLLHLEMNKYGTNINQIAKAINGIVKEKKELKFTIEQRKSISDLHALINSFSDLMTSFINFAHKEAVK